MIPRKQTLACCLSLDGKNMWHLGHVPFAVRTLSLKADSFKDFAFSGLNRQTAWWLSKDLPTFLNSFEQYLHKCLVFKCSFFERRELISCCTKTVFS